MTAAIGRRRSRASPRRSRVRRRGAAGADSLSSASAAQLPAGGSAERVADEVLAPLRRAGAEGRDATRAERRRLQAAFAAGSLPVALLLVDPLPAALLADGRGLLAPRARRLAARALHAAAGRRRGGRGDARSPTRSPAGIRPARRSRSPAHGARRADRPELSPRRPRTSSSARPRTSRSRRSASAPPRAASTCSWRRIRLQRRSGGNLAALLRDVAAALEDQARLEAEARTETAQARFTSTVVLAMPFACSASASWPRPAWSGAWRARRSASGSSAPRPRCRPAGAVLVRRLARVDT